MSWITAILGALKALGALFGFFSDKAQRDAGAAAQRDRDNREENERIAKADRAVDDVRAGGGVPVRLDPFNRDLRDGK